ncbi:MAG TPA: holo-ACP synthase [Ramlibacter sp.]|jgi:holo-[acyl-carrier protein] synthase
MTTLPNLELQSPAGTGVRLGFDLARISGIAESIRHFGRRFTDRIFTSHELDYALAGTGVCAERLAARFAAKEAVIKALGLSDAGVAFRDIEVVKLADGGCTIVLHGEARRFAARMGVQRILVSLSHDGDCAGAVVHALLEPPITTEA